MKPPPPANYEPGPSRRPLELGVHMGTDMGADYLQLVGRSPPASCEPPNKTQPVALELGADMGANLGIELQLVVELRLNRPRPRKPPTKTQLVSLSNWVLI